MIYSGEISLFKYYKDKSEVIILHEYDFFGDISARNLDQEIYAVANDNCMIGVIQTQYGQFLNTKIDETIIQAD